LKIRNDPSLTDQRHTPAALCLVLDAADDVYTVVDAKRVDMTPGDVVLTPSWCWHGHANDGSETAFWLDFLDVPFVRHGEAMFFEHYPEEFQRPTERYSAFRIPLATVLAGRTGVHSIEIAKDVMPTIGLHAMRLLSGTETEELHETANNNLSRRLRDRARHDRQSSGTVPWAWRRVGRAIVAWSRSARRRGCDFAASHRRADHGQVWRPQYNELSGRRRGSGRLTKVHMPKGYIDAELV
jgi:hypothetical protein